MAGKQAKMIGEYQIKGRLGSGGMATVHLVEKDGKQFAAKMLHQHLMRDRWTVSRFKKEFEIGQKMKANPAFVKMLEYIKADNCWTIIMEHVPGRTLQEMITKLAPFTSKEANAYIYELGDALGSFHLNNYVHRDLKPDNIIITPKGKVKIMDYGVTRDLDVNITKTGTAVGTPLYMSPEQICGAKSTDCRCDLYSLGLIYYRLLSRRDAHGMSNNFEFMKLVDARMTKPIKAIKGFEENDTFAFISKSLSTQPDSRHSSSKDFCVELKSLQSFSNSRTAIIKKMHKLIETNNKKNNSKVKIEKTIEQKRPKSFLFKLVLASAITAILATTVAFRLMGQEAFFNSLKSLFSQNS